MDSTQGLLDVIKKYKDKRILIAVKDSPDPDSIASAFALYALLEKHDIKAKMYYDHPISLPCNNRMVNELDINIVKIDSFKNITEEFDGYAVIDHQNVDLSLPFPCIFHIDHHKATKNSKVVEYQNVKLEAGSTATIITNIFKELDFLNGHPSARNIATALAFGIRVDTDGLTLANKIDYEAIVYLSEYYDRALLQSISRSTLSKTSLGSMIKALDPKMNNITILDNWLFAGIGHIKSTFRDTMAIIADILISVDGIENVVVYGIVENDKTNLEGCVRTFDLSYDLNNLLKTIAENSGAKKNKGGFKIPLGDFACVSDKEKLWDITKDLIITKFKTSLSKN